MKRLGLLGLIVLGTACLAVAQISLTTTGNAPEIDPSQAVSALALLSGGVLVIRGRLKK